MGQTCWSMSLTKSPTDERDRLRECLLAHLLTVSEPFTLASGQKSRYFLDGKAALANGDDLALACRVMLAELAAAGIEFDAVGGLTLGADQFSHGMAIVGSTNWFVVRKQPKGRGTDRFVEGVPLDGLRVVLVDDVITTGGSTLTAMERVVAEGAIVVGATCLVARSDEPATRFAAAGVPFVPVFDYAGLGIPCAGDEPGL